MSPTPCRKIWVGGRPSLLLFHQSSQQFSCGSSIVKGCVSVTFPFLSFPSTDFDSMDFVPRINSEIKNERTVLIVRSNPILPWLGRCGRSHEGGGAGGWGRRCCWDCCRRGGRRRWQGRGHLGAAGYDAGVVVHAMQSAETQCTGTLSASRHCDELLLESRTGR